jgi:hypothetical protein
MQKLHSIRPGKQGISFMFGHPCKECQTLFAEMRSAVDDAKSIAAEAGVLIYANKPSEHIDGWWQIRGRWQSANRRWMLASAGLKNHFATHHGTSISAKRVL